jgi:multiple sugar transport system substrate-binding protein
VWYIAKMLKILNRLTLDMISHTRRLTFLHASIGLLIIIVGSIFSSTIPIPTLAQQEKVTLTAMVSEPNKRWDRLFQDALVKLRERHPDMNITIRYVALPYDDTRKQILTALSARSPIDLISVDQIWLGDFAERGYLADITNSTQSWNRSSDWYEPNWKGGIYNDKVYGIWAWTDVRAMWYWKDLLNQSGVGPDSLKTWNGYIDSAKKINATLKDKEIQSMHLVAASHSPDMWYPYLWMLGGEILQEKDDHPSKGTYWYPTYNSSAGVKALSFLKEQVAAGIKPQERHFWGNEFADRKFAVMLEGSWLPGFVPDEQLENLGMIPMFPVSNQTNQNATLMGGWMLSIPESSVNKDLAWELLTIMLEPEVLAPMLHDNGYLPTQKSIGEGRYSPLLNSSIPYYEELVSMIPDANVRPSIPEYPEIADHIRQAIDEVYYGVKEPREALDDAAAKSALILGW